MSSNSNTDTQNSSSIDSRKASNSPQNGSSNSGRLAHLNPTAKEFSPGGAQEPVAPRSSQGNRQGPPKQHGSNASRRGRGRGGLSQALDRRPATSDAPEQQPQQDAAAARPTGGGRGRASANHLLNFQYEPRSSSRGGRGGGAGSYGQQRRRYNAPRPQKYDRLKFLQANFRFLVSDTVDTSAFSADADKMFDWDDVVQVEMMSAAPIQCPISLDSPPICPQITPCGHVFAFPSIMQHLINHGGEQLRAAGPCPLCFRPLVARDLRLVQVRQVAIPKAGDVVTFQLLRRPRTSIVPHPVCASSSSSSSSSAAAEPAAATPWSAPSSSSSSSSSSSFHNPLDANRFSKFATISDALPLWKAAAVELAEYAASVTSEGGLEAAIEAPFIYAALDSLAGRAKKWTELRAQGLEVKGLLPAGASVEGLAKEAEQAVKRLFTAAVQVVSEQKESEEKLRAQQQEFPALAPPPPAAAAAAAAAVPSSSRSAAAAAAEEEEEPATQFAFEPAFSDQEEEEQQRSSSSPPPPPPPAAAAAAAGGARSLTPSEASEGLLGSSPNTYKVQSATPAGDFFFYQASSGQWYFLDPLNLRCLLQHYSTYADCPGSISARILEVEDMAQSEATRRRYKFLAHLPLPGVGALLRGAAAEGEEEAQARS